MSSFPASAATSQTAVWLMVLSCTCYNVALGDLTLGMVMEVVQEFAAAWGCPFVLNDPEFWSLQEPLEPAFSIPVLSALGPRPFDATFCFQCICTWRSTPLGAGLPCEYPCCRPNQVKCSHCSESHHLCVPVCGFPLFSFFFFFWWYADFPSSPLNATLMWWLSVAWWMQ